MSITLNGTYSSTVTLTDSATQNPATVSSTGVIAVASPDAFSHLPWSSMTVVSRCP